MTEAVFRSIGQALHVSFLMDVMPPTQRSNTQVVIEQLMRDAGVTHEVVRDGTLNFSGLTPLEVRGQCAMVRGAVMHHCPEPERMAIWAWYAHNASKAEGVHFLRDYFAQHFTVEASSARTMITWGANLTEESRVARHCSIRDIAGQHGLAKSTVQRNLATMAKFCRGLRQSAELRLECLFAGHGLIDFEAVAAG